jgi:hypothetical protein
MWKADTSKVVAPPVSVKDQVLTSLPYSKAVMREEE